MEVLLRSMEENARLKKRFSECVNRTCERARRERERERETKC